MLAILLTMPSQKWIFKLILIASISLVTGCASLHEPPPPDNQTTPWGNRVQALSNIQSWDINGLIAIRNTSKPHAESANLHWQQSKLNYQILLFGPLGASPVKLSGKPGAVVLEDSKGKRFYADSAESMLVQQTGWRLPVSNLYFWVRGLPVPNQPAQKQFDTYHHLTHLAQDGWNIQYLNYTSVNHIDLPTKIFLNNSALQLKIIINQWKI